MCANTFYIGKPPAVKAHTGEHGSEHVSYHKSPAIYVQCTEPHLHHEQPGSKHPEHKGSPLGSHGKFVEREQLPICCSILKILTPRDNSKTQSLMNPNTWHCTELSGYKKNPLVLLMACSLPFRKEWEEKDIHPCQKRNKVKSLSICIVLRPTLPTCS